MNNIMHVVYHEDGSFGLSSIDIPMLMITTFTLWSPRNKRKKSSSINVNKVIYIYIHTYLKMYFLKKIFGTTYSCGVSVFSET